MESKEFDATLGGSEQLPYSANSFKFASSRSIEIAAMTENILRPSKTKLIFQTLPVHMRRRVMSHNCKRLPRKLREGHLEQLKKSGLAPKQKRPSRKYRRRPTNLLDAYNRRQRCNVWLETHIWHAKRFHMIDRWGHRLAYAPCDKAFRACYRATSTHCLMQDISYYTPIQIKGPIEYIKKLFCNITSISCGLSITAKAYTTGSREGSLLLYEPDRYPFGYIGKVSFIWQSDYFTNIRTVWLFVHPSQLNQIKTMLTDLLLCAENSTKIQNKKRKLDDALSNEIEIKVTPGSFNRFRLTGPNSQAILVQALKCASNLDSIKNNKWATSYFTKGDTLLKLEEKFKYWQNFCGIGSPSQLPQNIIVGLIVKDPRLSRPSKRSKAKLNSCEAVDIEHLIDVPEWASFSPIWNTNIHNDLKQNMLNNAQYIEHVTKNQMVPGAMCEDDPALQNIPVVLIQRPGSQDPCYKKLGYGCGWDIIVPSGYGLPTWQTFIMFGARAGGLRETESMYFEMGKCYLSPDSTAGKLEEQRIEREMSDKYFKRPPSKRVNYIKLGINSPFICHWKILLKDWCNQEVNDFYVLRDRLLLNQLQDCLKRKINLPNIDSSAMCLVPIYVQMVGRGNLKKYSVISMPNTGDRDGMDAIFEPHHFDNNEKLRKLARATHVKNIKKLRRKKMKLKKIATFIPKKQTKKGSTEPSEYVKKMRELWLPSKVESVRRLCSRETMGYVSQGAFSFSEAKSCGVGYIAYNALAELLRKGFNFIMVRNTCSRKYRQASLHIVKP